MTLPSVTPCNSEDTTVILIVIGVVGLVLNLFGYIIYRLSIGVFGFILGVLAAAAVGSLWLGETLIDTSHAEGSDSVSLHALTSADGSDSRAKMKMIVLAVCLIWGMIGAVMFQKLSVSINKVLGYAMGAALGVGLVAGLVFAVKDRVNEEAGPTYEGWEMFATIALGVPVALFTGYIARNSIKYCIMLATALGGAVVVVGTSMRALDCAEIDLFEEASTVMDEASTWVKPAAITAMVAILAGLGFVVQFMFQPKAIRERGELRGASCDREFGRVLSL
jgi:hypothetical protein